MKRSNERNSLEHFAKKSNFYSIDFLHFFAKRRKSAEKITHGKKIGFAQRPRSLNPRKVIAMAICPIIHIQQNISFQTGQWRKHKNVVECNTECGEWNLRTSKTSRVTDITKCTRVQMISIFITSILKSLVILAIWLALSSAIYSQIAPFLL